MDKITEDINKKQEQLNAAELIVFKLKSEINELYIMRGDKIREFSSETFKTLQS
jgi:hypothetical protein